LYHLGAYAQGKSQGDQFVEYCGAKLSQDTWAMKAFEDLLKGGVDLDIRDAEGRNCLMAAAATGEYATAERLFAQDAPNYGVESRDPKGDTPLHYAVRRSDEDSLWFIQLLLVRGANAQAANTAGKTPFEVHNQHVLAGVYKGCKDGPAPLWQAIVGAHPGLLKMVPWTSKNKESCLILAVRHHTAPKLMEALPQEQLDVKAASKGGWTALHFAVEGRLADTISAFESVPLLKALVAAGADPNALSEDGEKALDIAVRRQDERAIEYLLGVTRPRETEHSVVELAQSLNAKHDYDLIGKDLLEKIRAWEQQGLSESKPLLALPTDMKMPALEAKAQGLGRDLGRAAAGLMGAIGRNRQH
jgi:ankyrin repeat protein